MPLFCIFLPIYLSSMSFDGAISSMGKTRDDDGTVDRVADPPQNLWAVLAAFKYKCEVENLEIVSLFEVRALSLFLAPATHRPHRAWPRAC